MKMWVRVPPSAPNGAVSDLFPKQITVSGFMRVRASPASPLFTSILHTYYHMDDNLSKENQITQTPEFKNWFKNSVVVDEHGNPKVMYHTTGAEFTEFNPLSHFGTKGQSNSLYYGRMVQKAQKMDRTYPVYLSIQNPLRIDDEHDNSVLSLLGRIDKALYLQYMEEMHKKSDEINQTGRKKDELEYQKQIKFWKKSRSGPFPQVPTTNSDIATREFYHLRDFVMPRKYKPILIDSIKRKGYDGLVYKNMYETDEPVSFRMRNLPSEHHQKDSYVVFEPNQVKSAIGNIGKFDSNNPDITKEQLNESLECQRVYIVVDNQTNRQLGGPLKVQAVIGKNTKERDWPYRITWFNRDRTIARGHVSLKEDGYQYILKNKDLTIETKVALSEPFHCEPEDISLEFVNSFNESVNTILLLLEESSREIDLWIDNRRPY